MKFKNELIAWFVSWVLVLCIFELFGINDLQNIVCMIIFVIVYIPIIGIVRWIMKCKFNSK